VAKRQRDPLRDHFISLGFHFNWTYARIERELELLMGSSRYERYLDLCDARQAGRLSVSCLYEFPATMREANVLMSHQAAIVLSTARWLVDRVSPRLAQGANVIELGCWTGALSSWLAKAHPGSQFVGVDRARNVIDFAGVNLTLANLRFVICDYSQPPPPLTCEQDVLICALGIDFEGESRAQTNAPLDWDGIRASQEFDCVFRTATACFTNWRAISSPDGSLSVVLRVPNVTAFLAILDAARSSGWGWDIPNSQRIAIDGETLTGFIFESAAAPVGDHVALAWFSSDADAWGRYLTMGGRRVIEAKDVTDVQGNTMRFELGCSGDALYLFRRATTGFAEMLTGTPTDAPRFRAIFDRAWLGRADDMI
jgi:hypothetical protein